MAKTAAAPFPADIVKAQITQPVDPIEKAVAEDPAIEIDEADLDAADAAEQGVVTAPKVEFDLSEGPAPSEDPELVEKRRAAFKRAEEFEKRQEESRQRKAAMLAGALPKITIPEEHIGGGGDIPEIFYRYATAFPHTTPDEHIVCGYGSIKLTVGDFRRLIGLPTRT